MTAALDALLEDRPPWQELALCPQVDPELFFPEKGGGTSEAKKVCAVCEVKEACLQAALDRDERFGIWGGLSERERRRLRRGQSTLTARQRARDELDERILALVREGASDVQVAERLCLAGPWRVKEARARHGIPRAQTPAQPRAYPRTATRPVGAQS